MTSVALSESLRTSLQEATAVYHKDVGQVEEYLARRGITREAAAAHLLGYVTETNVQVGHEQYIGRLSIPYLTPSGVTDLRFRSVQDDGGPKYLGRAGADLRLYNPLAFKAPTDYIGICEGEMDCITANTLCSIPSVGLAGVNAWKPYYARAFDDYARVLVFCDGDQPGRELGKKIASVVDRTIVIHMPDGMDVNALYLSEGPDSIRRRAGVS